MRVPGTNFTVEEAIDWIEFCRDQYYNHDSAPVSNVEYDFIVDATRNVVPGHPLFRNYSKSDTSSGIRLKRPLHFPTRIKTAQSIKTGHYSIADTMPLLEAWINKVNVETLAVRPYFNGVPCVLYYTSGYLTLAVASYDGIQGRGVTEHIKRVRGVPFIIPNKITCEITGTVIMRNSRFAAFAPGQFASAYHAVTGSLLLRDYSLVEERGLDFCVHDIVINEQPFALSEHEKKTLWEHWGFQDSGVTFVNTLEEIRNLYIKFNTAKHGADTEQIFEDAKLNGIIVTVNDRAKQSELGCNNNITNFSVLLNFPMPVVTAKLDGLKLQVGKSGKIIRIGTFATLQLNDRSISSAAMSSTIPKQTGVGSEVVVSDMGIAPWIIDVITTKNKIPLDITNCPGCALPLSWQGKELFCTNINCTARVLAELKHYIAAALSQISIDTTILEAIYASGLLSSPADLYYITKPALMAVPGIGPNVALSIYANIGLSKDMNLTTLLYALGIPSIGRFWAEKIAQMIGEENGYQLLTPTITTFNYMSRLCNQSPKQRPMRVSAFLKFAEWLCSPQGIQTIQRLKEAGIRVLNTEPTVATTKTIGVYGDTMFPWQELQFFLAQYGYKLTKGIASRHYATICNAVEPKLLKKKTEIISEPLLIFKLFSGIQLQKDNLNNLPKDLQLSAHNIWDVAVSNAITMEQTMLYGR